MSDETPPEPVEPPLPIVVPAPPAAPTMVPPSGSPTRWFPGGSGFSTVRDMVLFVLGLGILAQQVFLADEVSSLIVSLGAAAVGLPVVLRTDSKTKG